MPACCDIKLVTFVNESTTTTPWTGDEPTVSVSYLVDGVWQVFVQTVYKLLPGSIVVDHGGVNTGVIKVLQ